MIQVDITEDHRKRATDLADDHAYKHSMRGTEANIVGALGEIVTFDYLQSRLRPCMFLHTPQYDILMDEDDPYTIDVKTKERSVVPLPGYDATVPAYNHDYQRPDIFIFTSVRRDKNIEGIDRFLEAHIIGWCTYDYLTEHAVFWNTSMEDHSNGWKPTIDCWNIRYELLKPMSDLP